MNFFKKKKPQNDDILNQVLHGLKTNPNQPQQNGYGAQQDTSFQMPNNPFGGGQTNQQAFNPNMGQSNQQGFNPNAGQNGGSQFDNNFQQNVNPQYPNNMGQGQQGFQYQQPPMQQNAFVDISQSPAFQPAPSAIPDSTFGFPMEQNQDAINHRINDVNLSFNEGFESPTGSSKFTVEDPTTMYDARKLIYELREKIHFLEATLTSVQTNYDNERNLSKKQTGTIDTYKKSIISVIQEVMQTQKYKYEKEHGEISQLSYEDLIKFLKDNLKEILSTERQRNAKLYSMLKEIEEKNKRLENQLMHNVQTGTISSGANANQDPNIFTNINNIDKINSILGGNADKKGGTNQNFPQAPDLNSSPVLINENKTAPVPTSAVDNSKINSIKQEIASFSADNNTDVALHQTEEAIIKVIGETGADNIDLLVNKLESTRGNLSENSFKTMLYNYRKKLVDKKLLEVENLELPMKGYHKIELFKLTQKGTAVFQQLFGKPSVPSNMVKRVNQHTSLPHAFVIEKIAEFLSLNKFEVLTDEKELRFPVEVDGKQYHVEFDLIAKKGEDTYYFEVEMGTTKDVDFNDKCNKNYEFNKKNNTPIIIVSPSKKIAETNLSKVNNWMKTRGGAKELSKEKKLKVLLPYFEEIKSNRWHTDKLELFIDLTRNDS